MWVEDYGFDPTDTPMTDTSSKHATRRSWPTRSISAECTGSAYMSGSKPRDHRKSVRYRATTRDINTCSKEASGYFDRGKRLGAG